MKPPACVAGGLKDACPEDMLAAVLKGVIERSGIDPKLIEDVAVGNVLPPGGGATVARMAALYAGIPNTAAVNTLNRQCSSGLASVAQIAHEVQLGQIEVGIGAGVESMTQNYGAGVMPEKMSDEVMTNQEAADCLLCVGSRSCDGNAWQALSLRHQADGHHLVRCVMLARRLTVPLMRLAQRERRRQLRHLARPAGQVRRRVVPARRRRSEGRLLRLGD